MQMMTLEGLPSPGLWLGEAAMTLTRNVDFEVPGMKKANARAQQQLVDLQRRREEHLHSASAAAAAYRQVPIHGLAVSLLWR